MKIFKIVTKERLNKVMNKIKMTLKCTSSNVDILLVARKLNFTHNAKTFP